MAEKKKSGASRGKASAKAKSSAGGARSKKQTKSADKEAVQNERRGMSYQTKSLLLFALAALFLGVVMVSGERVWLMVHNFFSGLFGFCGFLFPLLISYVAVITALERRVKGQVANRLGLVAGTIFCFSTMVYVFSANPDLSKIDYLSELGMLYTNGVSGNGAGLFGGIVGVPLVMMCGKLGAQIITVIALTVLVMLLFGVSIKNIVMQIKRPADMVKDAARADRERRRSERRAERENAGALERADEDSHQAVRRESFDVDVPLENVGGSGKGTKTRSKYDELKAAWDNANSNGAAVKSGDIPAASAAAKSVMQKKKKPRKSTPDQLQPDPQTVPLELERANDKPESDNGGYKYPPIDLLAPNPNEYRDSDEIAYGLRERGDKLLSTLESFGVRAKITDISRGPSVTRFELQPAAGIKISKITNLSDDIAMNLAAESVRIEAPIPGKAAVGIEIPNKKVSMVTMRELIGSQQFRKAKSKLSVVLGKDISGNIVITDLAKMPHLLIAGTTGSGKSVCVNSLLLSILFKATPDEVKIVLIDPKMVEFSKYKGVPHLLIPIVSDVKKAAGALNWAVSEMLDRYKLFASYGVKNIEGYNKMVGEYREKYKDLPPDTPKEDLPLTESGLPIPEEKMPKIVIAIDELADLMMAAPNEVEESICRLAQMARAAGMHLVIATQRPSVNVITGVIKANIPSRIALKTASSVDSRTIIDTSGADKLLGKGDMLFVPIGCTKPVRVQGGYASDDEIENVTEFTKKSARSDYDEDVVEQIEKIANSEISGDGRADARQGDDGDRDPMLEDAIKLVVEAGQASTSLLQRRLRLGYARAGRLIDEMEQMGIVGPHEGSKSRQVLMSHQEWLERNNILSE